MNEKEFLTVTSVIKASYPSQSVIADKASMDVWYTMLCDIDYGVCINAIKEIISTNKFAPSIADIREKCSQRLNKQVLNWGDAWGNVLASVRRFGYMNELEAVESLDDITRKCVKRIGYQNICRSENITADRANFRMIYEQEQEVIKTNNQIPSLVLKEKQNMIEVLVGNVVNQINVNNT